MLNWGTSAMLKFSLVPTHLPDGSLVSTEQLHGWISAHLKWGSASFIQRAHFVTPANKKLGLLAMVIVEVADDCASSTACHLLQTEISFGGVIHRAQPWSLHRPAMQCGICLKWGHSSHWCKSKMVWCSWCTGNHNSVSHDVIVKMAAPLPLLCVNCKGKHSMVSCECLFLAQFEEEKMKKLQEKHHTCIASLHAEKRVSRGQDWAEVGVMLLS